MIEDFIPASWLRRLIVVVLLAGLVLLGFLVLDQIGRAHV